MGCVAGYEVEGGVTGGDDGDGARDEGFPVVVGKVALLAEGLELRRDNRIDGVAVVFEVDEEDEGLGGVLFEDAVFGFGGGLGGGRVLLVEDPRDVVDVHGAEGAVGS